MTFSYKQQNNKMKENEKNFNLLFYEYLTKRKITD